MPAGLLPPVPALLGTTYEPLGGCAIALLFLSLDGCATVVYCVTLMGDVCKCCVTEVLVGMAVSD